MRLVTIQVDNFRSILTTQVLALDNDLTVILGPNNEGKSNLIRAITIALECLRIYRVLADDRLGMRQDVPSRLLSRIYNWESDFPQSLQEKQPDGETVLTLSFELTDLEQSEFKKACGCTINDNLPIEIKIGSLGAKFKVKKPGRGAKTYEQNSNKIARFISRNFEFEYIPAIRTESKSLEVISGLLDRELGLLSDNESYKKAIATIDSLQKDIYGKLEENVQRHLQRLLPSVKKVEISLPREPVYKGRFRAPHFIVNDGTATTLEAKGDGIKSLVAISLMRASRVSAKSGNLVVAIEEPESHLHPGAIRQLAAVLQEMSGEHQVIITTHSPLLVARSKIPANIIVSKSKANPAASIKAIRDCLGVHVEDNLTDAEFVILVEGKNDIESLSCVFAESSEFEKLFSIGKVVFDDLRGVSNVQFKISHLQESITTQILITDDDKAGRDADRKADVAGLAEKFRFTWKRPSTSFRASEFEDLIDPNLYWEVLQADFGVALDQLIFASSQESWSYRMKALYEGGGKRWSSSVEGKMKTRISKLVAENPSSAISEEHKSVVDNIIRAILDIIATKP